MDDKVTDAATALAKKFPIGVNDEILLCTYWEKARNAIIAYSRLHEVRVSDFYSDKWQHLARVNKARAITILQYAYPCEMRDMLKEFEGAN